MKKNGKFSTARDALYSQLKERGVYGVNFVGIGKENGQKVLIVGVTENDPNIGEGIPKTYSGIPVRIRNVGNIGLH